LWPLLAVQAGLVAKRLMNWLPKDCREMVEHAAWLRSHPQAQKLPGVLLFLVHT
jgi:hypothetical protein